MRTRDQDRALHAYARVTAYVKEASASERKDYKVAVNDLGAQTLRSGLAASLAFLERQVKRKAVARLLDDLAGAGIPGLSGQGKELPGKARALDLDGYVLATRELLRVSQWFKRAVQATLPDEAAGDAGEESDRA